MQVFVSLTYFNLYRGPVSVRAMRQAAITGLLPHDCLEYLHLQVNRGRC